MEEIKFKDLILNSDEKLFYLGDEALTLTKSEYNLLIFLLQNKNKIFSREELIVAAWDTQVSNRAVDTALSRLRKKLGNYSKYLVSRSGFGYGFMENCK